MRWRRKKPYLCTSVLSPTFKSRSVLGVSSGADFFVNLPKILLRFYAKQSREHIKQ